MQHTILYGRKNTSRSIQILGEVAPTKLKEKKKSEREALSRMIESWRDKSVKW